MTIWLTYSKKIEIFFIFSIIRHCYFLSLIPRKNISVIYYLWEEAEKIDKVLKNSSRLVCSLRPFFISINSQISRIALVVLIVLIVRTWLVVWRTACLSHAKPSEVRLTINIFLLFLFCFNNKESRNDRKSWKTFSRIYRSLQLPWQVLQPTFNRDFNRGPD